MKIACLRIVLRHVPVLQLHVHVLFKVLNRRSDRKSYTREGFIEMLKYYPLAMPKIYVSLF